MQSRARAFLACNPACPPPPLTLHPCSTTCRLVDELVQTSHSERVNDLAFPYEFSDVFATCGLGCIRIWHLSTCRELLRISVPNLEAHCITFSTVRRSGAVWGSEEARALAIHSTPGTRGAFHVPPPTYH